MKHKLLTLLALLVALMALGACTQTPPQTPEADQTAQTDETPAQTQEEPAQSPEVISEEAFAKELEDMFEKQANIEWMVSYDMTSAYSGEEFEGTMTQYVDGEEKMRMDMTAQGQETRTYMLDNNVYSCFNQDGSWSCMGFEQTEEEQETQTPQDIREDIQGDMESYEITSLGQRNIAGSVAQCYRLVGTDGNTVEYCFSSEGVPLYVKTTSNQGDLSEMTATSYSTNVASNAFELPAEPQSFAAGGTMPAEGEGMGDENPCSYCEQMPAEYRDQCLASC